jgi:hypothetical protein
MESWTRNFPALGEAHQAKEAFFRIYDHSDISEALAAYEAWQGGLSPAITPAFQPLITAVANWKAEIFAYFEHHVTNAYTESLNNLIRAVNRNGRGYSFDVLRAKILYTMGAHKVIQSAPKFTREDRFYYVSSTDSGSPTVNYGADISTLLRLMDEGMF